MLPSAIVKRVETGTYTELLEHDGILAGLIQAASLGPGGVSANQLCTWAVEYRTGGA